MNEDATLTFCVNKNLRVAVKVVNREYFRCEPIPVWTSGSNSVFLAKGPICVSVEV